MKISKTSKVQTPYVIEDYLNTSGRLSYGDICVLKDHQDILFTIVQDLGYNPKCDINVIGLKKFFCECCPLFDSCAKNNKVFKRVDTLEKAIKELR